MQRIPKTTMSNLLATLGTAREGSESPPASAN
jgi:hypothetical protein